MFEYKLVKINTPNTLREDILFKAIEEQLNYYGKYGWELCCVGKNTAYFKRKIGDKLDECKK